VDCGLQVLDLLSPSVALAECAGVQVLERLLPCIYAALQASFNLASSRVGKLPTSCYLSSLNACCQLEMYTLGLQGEPIM
jgi:hypothetical protein